MPNKYIYQKMGAAEFKKVTDALGLTSSDLVKLFGRHYAEIMEYRDPAGMRKPQISETILLEFMLEYPEYKEVFIDLAEVRIIGQHRKKETA